MRQWICCAISIAHFTEPDLPGELKISLKKTLGAAGLVLTLSWLQTGAAHHKKTIRSAWVLKDIQAVFWSIVNQVHVAQRNQLPA